LVDLPSGDFEIALTSIATEVPVRRNVDGA